MIDEICSHLQNYTVFKSYQKLHWSITELQIIRTSLRNESMQMRVADAERDKKVFERINHSFDFTSD